MKTTSWNVRKTATLAIVLLVFFALGTDEATGQARQLGNPCQPDQVFFEANAEYPSSGGNAMRCRLAKWDDLRRPHCSEMEAVFGSGATYEIKIQGGRDGCVLLESDEAEFDDDEEFDYETVYADVSCEGYAANELVVDTVGLEDRCAVRALETWLFTCPADASPEYDNGARRLRCRETSEVQSSPTCQRGSLRVGRGRDTCVASGRPLRGPVCPSGRNTEYVTDADRRGADECRTQVFTGRYVPAEREREN